MEKSNSKKTKIIAVEEHYMTESYMTEYARLSAPNGEEQEFRYMKNFQDIPEMRQAMVDFEYRLAVMDKSGTDMAVLSINSPGVQMCSKERAPVLAKELNDGLADIIKRYPGRFAGLGLVSPQDPDAAAQEVKRITGQLGLGGIMIYSHTEGHYLDEAQFDPILAAAEEADATIYLHPRVPSPEMLQPYSKYGMMAALWGFAAEAGTHAMRLILSGVFDRYPKLKIVMGHFGEALPFWMWRLDNMYKKTWDFAGPDLGMVKLELNPTDYLKRNITLTTSGMFDPDVLTFCVQKLGAQNIMFAVDYPYESSVIAVNFLQAAELTDHDRELISHGNAERLFRIPA